MTAIVLDDIRFEPGFGVLASRLHVNKRSPSAKQLEQLLAAAQSIARPKALYRVAYVKSRAEDGVNLDGHWFRSRVLRVKLEDVHRAFPFVATCGRELYDWKMSMDDGVERLYADTINEVALDAAREALRRHLIREHRVGRTGTINPGSLKDWPIYGQRPLFALLGDPAAAIGVHLTESMWMIPHKSISGIRFATEEQFESCSLCPRDVCSSREAAYEEGLYEAEFALSPRGD